MSTKALLELIQTLPLFTNLEDDVYIHTIKEQISPFLQSYKQFIILGTGGSTMTGQALHGFLQNDNVYFWDNIDPQTFARFKQKMDKDACFVIISKSGNTSEVLTQIKAVKPHLSPNNVVVVTQKTQSNKLLALAVAENWTVIEHPDVGGRFSAFTAVGIIPCLLLGYDPELFRKGARYCVQAFLKGAYQPLHSAESLMAEYQRGKKIHVLWGYGDHFTGFLNWTRQLIAESLGKNEDFGITPILNRGTIDEHSQLQLYLDGPRDKVFSFFRSYNNDTDDMNLVFESHFDAVYKTLEQEGHFCRTFDLTLENLGYVMMYFMLEVIGLALYANIDPFDQPGVERCKHLLRSPQ